MTPPPHPPCSASHLLPRGEKALSRRFLLAAPLALAACTRSEAVAQAPAPAPLKSLVPFPVGTAAMAGHFDDPRWTALATEHFNQLTPEWEMKMEYILTPGGYRFDAPDRLADEARARDMRLHGHALIWYSQGAQAFRGLDRAAFIARHDDYIATVAGRYRGRVAGWDVVNEPVAEDGNGLRDCHWSEVFGQDGYIIRAFEKAREADPEAVLFLNEYNLENNPTKGATFLRLVERLLKAGAPIGGLGTQSHLDIEIPDGQITAFMREAAQFGLPIHVSELDASLRRDRGFDRRSRADRIAQQSARVRELAAAFAALPRAQQYAFSVWGVRDTDSWLRRDARDDGKDSPVLLDQRGGANPMFGALVEGFGAG